MKKIDFLPQHQKKVYFCVLKSSGCGAVGLAHLHGVQGVVRSSRITPTELKKENVFVFLFLYFCGSKISTKNLIQSLDTKSP